MGLLDYIKANIPRSTRPVANPLTVINQGLLNPNQYNAPAANRFKDSMFGLLGIVPGVGDAASAAESADLFNRGDKFGGSLAALGALPLVPSLVGAGATLGGLGVMHKVAQKIGTPLPAGPARNQAGAIVYHGSPHKFSKFDMSKIGTGEGAQAYGHGLYFAESPAVARSYLEANGAPTYMVNGVDVGNTTPTAYAAKLLSTSGTPPRQAVNNSRNLLSKAGKIDAEKEQYFKDTLAEIDRLEQLAPTIEKGGAFYKVDIPDESIPRMLDWDKPLSADIPQETKDAFNRLVQQNPDLKDAMFQAYRDKKPGHHYYSLLNDYAKTGDLVKNQAYATERLKAAGIPGIRYLDGMSRGKGGTSNFVLFDDQLPRILEINGQPTGLLSYADEAAQAAKKKGGLLGVPMQDFTKSIKVNNKLTQDATARNGLVEVGPKFWKMSPDNKAWVLTHENTHLSGIEDVAMRDNSFWDAINQRDMFGKIDPDTGAIKNGINGQYIPSENLIEAITAYKHDPEWLLNNYPVAYEYIEKLFPNSGR